MEFHDKAIDLVATHHEFKARWCTRATLLVLMATLSLLGCDSLSGVTRSADVPYLPSTECVTHALEAIPGVTRVRHKVEQGGRPLTWHGLERADTLYYYHYEVEGVPGSLYFVQDYQGRVEFHQGRVYINRRMPRQEFDTIYPIMQAVERQLELHCGLIDLTPAVDEHRSGIDCGTD